LKSTFTHAKRRENFFTIIDRHPDHTLRCVYSGDILSDSDGNFLQKCDEEHSFPQSYQRGSKAGTGRDMHAIFSAGKSANGSRGNTPFGNFGKLVAEDEYGKTYRDGKLSTYEPKLNSGAVARASLYVLMCYKNCANENYLPKRCLEWLVKQASETEVS
jgi:endonuclease I